jgi:hypothetical protein
MWLDINKYNPQNICAICFGELGVIQSIYEMPCHHIFHNNCLSDYCESNRDIIKCPICRSNPEYTCTDVWAFKENALGGNLDEIPPHVINIYLQQQQPHLRQNSKEGGKKYLLHQPKRKKTARKIHKKSKKRKTKSNKTFNKKSHL